MSAIIFRQRQKLQLVKFENYILKLHVLNVMIWMVTITVCGGVCPDLPYQCQNVPLSTIIIMSSIECFSWSVCFTHIFAFSECDKQIGCESQIKCAHNACATIEEILQL